MPRFARLDAPGALVHVITRFVDHEFRIESDAIRRRVRDRVASCLSRVDWIWLAFAIMSNHIHMAVLAGRDRFERWAGPLDTWLALYLNRAQGRYGPVLQERPTTVYMPPHHASRLIPYIHNNPVRAGCTGRREDPAWTSHRAYLGEGTVSAGLDVDRGLELCGCSATADGRETFARLVDARAADVRDGELSGSTAVQRRRRARVDSGAPLELTSPVVVEDGLDFEVVDNSIPARPLGIPVPPMDVVATACLLGEVDENEVLGRSRQRDLVAVRRVAARVWRGLGRPLVEMGRVLGVSNSSMSRLADPRTASNRAVEDGRVEAVFAVLARGSKPTVDLGSEM